MRAHRFYITQPLSEGETVRLPTDIHHHCCHVLRLKTGSQIQLFNDTGGDYQATLIVEKKKALATITAFTPLNHESPCQIHLFQGISKGDKMDWAVQKATELGVTQITPMMTEYCTLKQSAELLEKKQRHWQKIAQEAACQSLRSTVPTIHPPVHFEKTLPSLKEAFSVMLHPWAEDSAPWPQSIDNQAIHLLIGPEGGFSERESQLAHDAGCYLRVLGPRVLRTETATVSALTLLQHLYGDF